jgi:hypothetical protein
LAASGGAGAADDGLSVQRALSSLAERLAHLERYELDVRMRHFSENSGRERLDVELTFQVLKYADATLSLQPRLRVLSTRDGSVIVNPSRKQISVSKRATQLDSVGAWNAESLRDITTRPGVSVRHLGIEGDQEILEGRADAGSVNRVLVYIDRRSALLSKLIYFHREADESARTELNYYWRPAHAQIPAELRREYYVSERDGALVPAENWAEYRVVQID